MEAQLQQILASQQKEGRSIGSQSLDASSPEGRQTWMNLGRLLREEGITPAMIRENRHILISAMKTSLERQPSLAESVEQSYRTAREYGEYSHEEYLGSSTRSPTSANTGDTLDPSLTSTSLLSSAPRQGASFPDVFLERHGGLTTSLNQRENVETGMKSLLRGMNADRYLGEITEDADMGLEEAARLSDASLKTKSEQPAPSTGKAATTGAEPRIKGTIVDYYFDAW